MQNTVASVITVLTSIAFMQKAHILLFWTQGRNELKQGSFINKLVIIILLLVFKSTLCYT